MTDILQNASYIRVESAEEQYGYMIARFGEPSGWGVESQQLEILPDGRQCETVVVSLPGGDTATVRFVPLRDDGLFDQLPESGSSEKLDRIMEIATTFSHDNPPHHPGTIARFPVPSRLYAKSVAVPMAVLAQDQGHRGLYAPPRVVVLDYDTVTVRGVGEYPGFDPDSWPPKRVGDWPPTGIVGRNPAEVQAIILRFGALWIRILDAWFDRDHVPAIEFASELEEANALRERLDVPGMAVWYESLNPVFAHWLAKGGERSVK